MRRLSKGSSTRIPGIAVRDRTSVKSRVSTPAETSFDSEDANPADQVRGTQSRLSEPPSRATGGNTSNSTTDTRAYNLSSSSKTTPSRTFSNISPLQASRMKNASPHNTLRDTGTKIPELDRANSVSSRLKRVSSMQSSNYSPLVAQSSLKLTSPNRSSVTSAPRRTSSVGKPFMSLPSNGLLQNQSKEKPPLTIGLRKVTSPATKQHPERPSSKASSGYRRSIESSKPLSSSIPRSEIKKPSPIRRPPGSLLTSLPRKANAVDNKNKEILHSQTQQTIINTPVKLHGANNKSVIDNSQTVANEVSLNSTELKPEPVIDTHHSKSSILPIAKTAFNKQIPTIKTPELLTSHNTNSTLIDKLESSASSQNILSSSLGVSSPSEPTIPTIYKSPTENTSGILLSPGWDLSRGIGRHGNKKTVLSEMKLSGSITAENELASFEKNDTEQHLKIGFLPEHENLSKTISSSLPHWNNTAPSDSTFHYNAQLFGLSPGYPFGNSVHTGVQSVVKTPTNYDERHPFIKHNPFFDGKFIRSNVTDIIPPCPVIMPARVKLPLPKRVQVQPLPNMASFGESILSPDIKSKIASEANQNVTHLVVNKEAVVCSSTIIQGNYPITIGSKTIIHPGVYIDAISGPITIADCNIIQECVEIVNRSTNELIIGNYNLLETGTQILDGCIIGDGNCFEPRCLVEGGAKITTSCVISVGMCVPQGTTVPPNSVVSGPLGNITNDKTAGKGIAFKKHKAQQLAMINMLIPCLEAVHNRRQSTGLPDLPLIASPDSL